MCRYDCRNHRSVGAGDFEGESFRRAASASTRMGFSKCGRCDRYEQRGGDPGLVWSSPNASRTAKLPNESFEQISSFSVVLERTEARRCGREQTDFALLSALIGYFHSLLHIANEKRFRKHWVVRMGFDCFPDTHARGWEEDQCLHVCGQPFAELSEIEITLVTT